MSKNPPKSQRGKQLLQTIPGNTRQQREQNMEAITLIAEERIRCAQEDGKFNNLPGAGKPLNLEDESRIPEELRLTHKILKNAGYLNEDAGDDSVDVRPQDLSSMLKGNPAERETTAQMKKLAVLQNRVAAQRGRAVALDDRNPYYEKVVARVHVRGEDPK